jgi:hypothetical protein
MSKSYKGVLVTLAEHVSKKTLIAPVPSNHAEVVKDAIIKLLKSEKALLIRAPLIRQRVYPPRFIESGARRRQLFCTPLSLVGTWAK